MSGFYVHNSKKLFLKNKEKPLLNLISNKIFDNQAVMPRFYLFYLRIRRPIF